MEHSNPLALDLFCGIGGMSLGVHRCASNLGTYGICDSDNDCTSITGYHFSVPRERRFTSVKDLRVDKDSGIELVFGGFPCQDVSRGRARRAGVGKGTRSGLFRELTRLAQEACAPYVMIENVSALVKFGLDEVLSHLPGYECRVVVLKAGDLGAPHQRERVFMLGRNRSFGPSQIRFHDPGLDVNPWAEEPDVPRMINIPPSQLKEPLRWLGNACVPQQASWALAHMLGAKNSVGGGGTLWDELWDRNEWDASVLRPLKRKRKRKRSGIKRSCPTPVAIDSTGGYASQKDPKTGVYRSLSLSRWVRRKPRRGMWGTLTSETPPSCPRGYTMNPVWECWIMGFPLDHLLPFLATEARVLAMTTTENAGQLA